ncbi:hypothetical protein DBB36_11000 [Flavobacterium sp. WLB]|nr:hypothetical protein AKO67_21425 [Flavobacterium sp. VMW]OWU88676.1 hypothetical protein APR43_21825 [Flavobacterium sp. NLM]PUU69990.1 hypothetical protein DBB36_11000 [Flavobacterium sp. WLB]
MFFVVSAANATDYYSKSTGNLNTLATWGTNTDGSGTAPVNFTAAGNIFYIRNNTAPTVSNNWTVSGTGSKIVLGDGTTAINFTVAGNNVITAAMDILASGTLTLTTTGNTAITFGTLAATSTVNYGETGNQNVLAGSYGNLIISGSNTKTFPASTITVVNNLSIANGVILSLSTATTHTAGTLTFNGNGQNSGVWGSTASTAANKSGTYLGTAAVGRITIGTTTCTTGYWTGVTDTNWNTATNWCGNTVPTATTDVVIPSGTPNSPNILAGVTAVPRNLTINNSATLTLANSATALLNISGDFTNNGTLTTGANSTISFVGTANQNIGGFTTTGLISMTKTGGTATFTGNVTSSNAGALTINGTGGTLNLGSSLSHTFTSVVLTNGFLNGSSSIINLSAATPFTGTTSNFQPATGTVNLNGAAQNTVLSNFYNLTLSGTGNKTFANVTTIANILTIANTNAKANLGGFATTHTASALILGTATKTVGVYGGTGSTGTTIDTGYFANATGKVTISTDSCVSFATVAPITQVTLNTLSNSVTGTAAYEIFAPSGTATTTVTRGDYYSLVVKGNTNGNYNMYYTAFFDWNGNGTFDSGEGPINLGTIRNSSGSDDKATSAYFQIPTSATAGTNVKMRIIGLRGAYNTTSCTVNTGVGQVEDYTITIQAGCTETLPSVVSTNTTATTVCPNVPFTLSLGSIFGEGVTYLWQTGSSSTGPWSGAATPSIAFYNNDFSTDQPINSTAGIVSLSGEDTMITGGALVLTDVTAGGHNGGFFINKANIDNINPFTATFKYRVWDGGTTGADGLSLSYGPGFTGDAGGGENGEGSGLRVQFDTYDNEDVATGSRVRIVYNNVSIFNAGIDDPFNLRTSTFKDVKLYVDTNGYLSLDIQNSSGTMITVVSKLLLPNYSTTDKSTWKFKFSARTGGLKDKHSIDDLNITFLDSANSKSKFTTSQTTKTYYRAIITCGLSSVNSTPVLVDMSTAAITTQPTAPTAVCSGAGVSTISVVAAGAGLTYSWRLAGNPVTNGGVISGQGTNTLTLTNPTATNAGNYTVVVSDACSTSVTSNAVAVTVNPTPTLTGASQAATVCAGSSATINLTGLLASSTSTVSYTINGVAQTPVTGVTATAGGTASFTSAALTAANNGQTLQITGITTTSSTPNCTQSFTTNVTLAVNPSPTLTGASQAAAVCVGSSATINLTGLRASSTFTVSYTINGVAQTSITGLTATAGGTASFTTPALTAANNGQTLQITGITTTSSTPNCSQSFTTNVTLAVNPTPTLSGASQAAAVCVGSSATINLAGLLASSTSTVSYTINGVAQTPVTGVTATAGGTASFTTPVLTAANNGQTLRITGITTTSSTPNCSQTFTTNVTLAVNPTPTLTGASQAAAVCVGSSATINLTGLLASSTSTVSYTINGVAQTPVTSVTATAGGTASFTTPLLTAANNGQTLQITGITTTSSTPNCSQSFTTNVTLTVNALPTITTHPQAIAVCEGKNHTFTIVTSAGSPSYQWQYSPDNSTWTNTNGAAGVTGHTTASLNVANIPLSYSGYYVRCIITVGTCSSTSNSALLTVNPTPTAPTASVTTQPTCAAPTATITVSSPAPAAGITYSIDGTTYTNTTGIFTGVATGSSYNVTTKNSSGCESPITVVTVNTYAGKTWNGSVSTNWNVAGNWTPSGVPTVDDCVVIPDLTSIANKPEITGTNIEYKAHSINLNNNSSFIVRSTTTLTVTNAVTVNTGSTLTFENNASLVQTTNAVNSGNITYLRSTTPVNRYDYVYWSVPVTATPGITLHDLSPTTLADKYQSFNPTSGWVISYNGTQVMTPGQGYIVRGPQENVSAAVFQASFTGVPNNGDFTITPVATKWHLIGNPYPSAISANKLITDAGTGALYFWTHTNQPDENTTGNETYNYDPDDYSVYTLSGSTGTSNGPPASGKIAAGQGFFFKASTGSDVVFTNSMRIPGENSQFFKTAADIERNRVWLNMSTTTGLFKQVLVGYIDGATNSWDQNYDAATLNGSVYLDFYSLNEAKKLTIQGRGLPFEDTDLVPLGYRTAVAGEFTIAIDHTDGLLNNQAVYLEDKVTSKVHDLKAGNYKFTTEIGTFTDRFVLRYTNKTLGTGDFENVKDGLLVSVKDKVIKVTSSKENIKEVSVFDITGKLLYNKKKVETTEFSISNLQAEDQVLLVKVTLENKAEVTRKIIFK